MQKKHVYYLQTLGKALEISFPELEFMIKNFSFIDPPQRKLHQCNIGLVIDKFVNGDGMQFNKTTVYKQYRNYCHDTTLDFHFEVTSNSDPVKFFVKLYEDEEYNELARLPLLIYAISPDSVTCECVFSIMNYIKNQY